MVNVEGCEDLGGKKHHQYCKTISLQTFRLSIDTIINENYATTSNYK